MLNYHGVWHQCFLLLIMDLTSNQRTFCLAILKTFSKVYLFIFCSEIYNFIFNSMTYFELILYKMWSLWCSGFLLSLFLTPECGRPEFDPWVGKIHWRRERLPTSIFWPGEFHRLESVWGCRVTHDHATFMFRSHSFIPVSCVENTSISTGFFLNFVKN